MIFNETAIHGVYIIEAEPVSDHRGSFGRWFDREQFATYGLVADFDQDSFAVNDEAGTLRGLHYQTEPHGETKLVVCVSGSALDVVVDLRQGPMFGTHVAIALCSVAWRAVYIPSGCAHGYQSTASETTMLYRIAGPYEPAAACGIRWDDPELDVDWPLAVTKISQRDSEWPTLRECANMVSRLSTDVTTA